MANCLFIEPNSVAAIVLRVFRVSVRWQPKCFRSLRNDLFSTIWNGVPGQLSTICTMRPFTFALQTLHYEYMSTSTISWTKYIHLFTCKVKPTVSKTNFSSLHHSFFLLADVEALQSNNFLASSNSKGCFIFTWRWKQLIHIFQLYRPNSQYLIS